jgi:hypothetical protein
MNGVGGPASGTAPAASLEKSGCSANGETTSTPSILIDFTPITFNPRAEAAISALFFALATACLKDHF